VAYWIDEPHLTKGNSVSQQLPETDQDHMSRPFAELALRIVSLAVSEGEVERTISMQGDISGNKATRMGTKIIAA
jgi:hypothetical protein